MAEVMVCSTSISKRVMFALIFAAVFWQWAGVEAGTRWLPSIIWDGLNPLLKCKCNWMIIPQLDEYDRVELLCAKPYLVSAFREQDVSKARVYYNIFMRKFKNGTLNDLKRMLDDHSFCDPAHKDTKKLHTCERNGDASYKVRIHTSEGFNSGDIAVIFCNSDTGEQSDLTSRDKKCAMVFVVNVTDSSGREHDMSYNKCFKTDKSKCADINNTCGCRRKTIVPTESISTTNPRASTVRRTTTVRKTTSVRRTTSNPSTTGSLETDKVTLCCNSRPTKDTNSNTSLPEKGGRCDSNSDKSFSVWQFALGIPVGIVIGVILALVFIYFAKTKGKLSCAKKPLQETVTPVYNATTGVGFSNKAFGSQSSTATPKESLTVTPLAPPKETSGYDYVGFKVFRTNNGRLPSVEASQRTNSLPPLNNKSQLPRTNPEQNQEKQG